MLQPILTQNIEENSKYIVNLYNKNSLLKIIKETKKIYIFQSLENKRQNKYTVWDVLLDNEEMRMVRRITDKQAKYDFYKLENNKAIYIGSADTLYTTNNIIQTPYELYSIIIELCQ